MASRSRTLYIGVTNDLERRVYEHKLKLIAGFTSRYNISKLVWFDEFDDVDQAIEGEKKLKGWRRVKKVVLIESTNPQWLDLAGDWFPVRQYGLARVDSSSRDSSAAKTPSE